MFVTSREFNTFRKPSSLFRAHDVQFKYTTWHDFLMLVTYVASQLTSICCSMSANDILTHLLCPSYTADHIEFPIELMLRTAFEHRSIMATNVLSRKSAL